MMKLITNKENRDGRRRANPREPGDEGWDTSAVADYWEEDRPKDITACRHPWYEDAEMEFSWQEVY